VYNGSAPATVQGRRAALVGWVGAIFDMTRVLDQAVNASGDLGVTLAGRGDGGGSEFLVTTGARARPGQLSDRIGLSVPGEWAVTVSEAPASGLASGRVQGMIVGATIALIALMVVLALRRSVTARRRAGDLVDEQTDEFHQVMLHDPLTGLPNHALITDRAEQMLARNRRNRTVTAALVLGLDHFSDVNGLYSWATGDKLLDAVAERLSAAMREADTVGRLAGDEFVVLAEGASLAAGPEVVAERLLDILRAPFHLGAGTPSEITISASVGIALGPRLTAESLLRDAGIAMRQAKQEGTGRYALFELDAPQAVESRLALEADLRRAVADEEFVLRYQPIFDIESRTTTGLEALLRWERPDGRLLPPDHFLPYLERARLMDTVGRFVVNEACRQAAYLHRRGRPVSMAVNVSASQLKAESLPADVAEALSKFDLDPHALVIDIAEMTLLENTDLALERLTALRQIGVRIAVDDFGTGFSSLAYLRRFPIDILKIDRSFIASMSTPAESSTVMHTLVQFGQSLGLEVIAEGIEEEGQIDPLIAANCDSGQGFLYGRPLTAVQLDLFLNMHETAGAELWAAPPR
jgi:diguanylate cyclase (GGDEF)-like protein